MKKFIYLFAGLLILASCVHEPENPESEAVRVPFNVTIQTRAGGDGAPDHDIKSVRILVFKNTGDATTDLLVLNEIYSFGYGVEDRTDGRYTVSVKPTLQLDINTDLYYVYAVLNEVGYSLVDGKNLPEELEDISSRSELAGLLATKAVYDKDNAKDAPYCLMAGCKTVDFSTGKDLPIEINFGFDKENADQGGALDRTMAQITVESIKSAENATSAAMLPKVFVLDVQLVNVPSGIAWGNDGNTTAGGKVSLPIGAPNDTLGSTVFYKRLWDGNVYKKVQVDVDCEQRMTANYYRTDATGNTNWAFYDDRDGATPITKHIYQGLLTAPTAPTPVVDKPFGFPELNGKGTEWQYKKSKYKTDKSGATVWDGNEDKNAKIADYANSDAAYTAAYNDYISSLPNAGDGRNPNFVTLDQAEAYNTYWPLKKQYDTELAAFNAEQASVYAAAVTGRKSMDAKYAAGNSVAKLISDLETIFQKETYYCFNEYTVKRVSSTQPTDYVTYCSEDKWTVNLGDSYYVPENISTTLDNNSTTCIKVTLAVANPEITVPSTIDITKLPAASKATGGTFTYFFDHHYHTKPAGGQPSKLETQTFDLKRTAGGEPKIKKTVINAQGNYDNPQAVDFSVATLFELDGHIADADDETIECTAATTNNKYVVYIDGQSFWRTGTGLTATTIVDNDQDGATFNWNIPTADDPATTGFKEVKEFYIPVNNAQFDGDYSVKRNTKYTVKLVVGDNTYDSFTRSPRSSKAGSKRSGLYVTANVTAEKMTDHEK